MPNQSELIASWKWEEQRPFTGWDFSYLDGRWHEETPPWSLEGFSVDTHLDKLLALQARPDRGESLRFKIGKLMLKAQKGSLWD